MCIRDSGWLVEGIGDKRSRLFNRVLVTLKFLSGIACLWYWPSVGYPCSFYISATLLTFLVVINYIFMLVFYFVFIISDFPSVFILTALCIQIQFISQLYCLKIVTILNIPHNLKAVDPVSYTHLDVYKRQYFSLVICLTVKYFWFKVFCTHLRYISSQLMLCVHWLCII